MLVRPSPIASSARFPRTRQQSRGRHFARANGAVVVSLVATRNRESASIIKTREVKPIVLRAMCAILTFISPRRNVHRPLLLSTRDVSMRALLPAFASLENTPSGLDMQSILQSIVHLPSIEACRRSGQTDRRTITRSWNFLMINERNMYKTCNYSACFGAYKLMHMHYFSRSEDKFAYKMYQKRRTR